MGHAFIDPLDGLALLDEIQFCVYKCLLASPIIQHAYSYQLLPEQKFLDSLDWIHKYLKFND